MDEKELARRMKENPDLQIDASATASKKCDRCSFQDGVHDMLCPTNNEYDFYPCIRCNAPTIQYAMQGGMCPECQPFDPLSMINNPIRPVRDESKPVYLTDYEIWNGRELEPGEVAFEGINHLITAVGDITKAGLDFKSKTEREAWYEWLPTIEHVKAEYEPMSLKVAGANYTPDIVLLRPDGRIWFIEVKGAGGWKAYKSGRSSKRSLKQCSRYYAWLGDFYLLMKIPKKEGGGWHFEQY